MNAIPLAAPRAPRRVFFVAMAAGVLLTVFAGFAPTFYLRGSFPQTRPMSVLLHVHGVVFSAWVTLFLIQAVLVARGDLRLHRRLGWVTVGVAAAMVALVFAAVIEQLRRVNGFPPPPLALALSVFDIIVFAGLVGAAILLRRRSDWHKRLMLSATILLLGAPMFRFVIHVVGVHDMKLVGLVSMLLVDAFFLPCFAYDLATRRRIHPAFMIGFLLLVLDQLAQIWVVDWPPWVSLAQALQRLVS
jgi:uncharacterized membrane protein YozB (DUF420 family)